MNKGGFSKIRSLVFGGLVLAFLFIPLQAKAQLAPSTSLGLADSPWPVFHGDTKQTGQSKYDTSKVDGSVKWRFKTSGGVETSPAVGTDGTIYIADHACNLYAITPEGKEKWRFDAGEPVHSIEWGGRSWGGSW